MVNFERDPTALLADEFRRLSLANGWGKKSARYKRERRNFYGSAAAQDFASFWGNNDSRLDAWQDLCRHLGMTTIPTGIRACKKVSLKLIHVNLIDLVDSKRQNFRPRTFSSESALAEYIRNSGKVFLKEKAKANPLLRQFLIVVFG
ncbi:hypothetical protein BV20DRAFT_938490 [Pilatotrama ljubarskyi]|nr:hypothetical protein BV20DRAFT_938490 [Pilatotrama ljubarskyi]